MGAWSTSTLPCQPISPACPAIIRTLAELDGERHGWYELAQLVRP